MVFEVNGNDFSPHGDLHGSLRQSQIMREIWLPGSGQPRGSSFTDAYTTINRYCTAKERGWRAFSTSVLTRNPLL